MLICNEIEHLSFQIGLVAPSQQLEIEAQASRPVPDGTGHAIRDYPDLT